MEALSSALPLDERVKTARMHFVAIQDRHEETPADVAKTFKKLEALEDNAPLDRQATAMHEAIRAILMWYGAWSQQEFQEFDR